MMSAATRSHMARRDHDRERKTEQLVLGLDELEAARDKGVEDGAQLIAARPYKQRMVFEERRRRIGVMGCQQS